MALRFILLSFCVEPAVTTSGGGGGGGGGDSSRRMQIEFVRSPTICHSSNGCGCRQIMKLSSRCLAAVAALLPLLGANKIPTILRIGDNMQNLSTPIFEWRCLAKRARGHVVRTRHSNVKLLLGRWGSGRQGQLGSTFIGIQCRDRGGKDQMQLDGR